MNKTVKNVFIGSLLVGAGIKVITVIRKKNKTKQVFTSNNEIVSEKKKKVNIHDLVDRRKYTCIADVKVKEKIDDLENKTV